MNKIFIIIITLSTIPAGFIKSAEKLNNQYEKLGVLGKRKAYAENFHEKKSKSHDKNNKRLMESISRNDFNSLTQAIHDGADVNHTDNQGWSPLLIATKNNRSNFINILIKSGAHSNPINGEMLTPLLCAIIKNHIFCAEALIKSSTNLNNKHFQGHTILTMAKSHSKIYLSPEMEALLIAAGAHE